MSPSVTEFRLIVEEIKAIAVGMITDSNNFGLDISISAHTTPSRHESHAGLRSLFGRARYSTLCQLSDAAVELEVGLLVRF